MTRPKSSIGCVRGSANGAPRKHPKTLIVCALLSSHSWINSDYPRLKMGVRYGRRGSVFVAHHRHSVEPVSASRAGPEIFDTTGKKPFEPHLPTLNTTRYDKDRSGNLAMNSRDRN